MKRGPSCMMESTKERPREVLLMIKAASSHFDPVTHAHTRHNGNVPKC